MMFYKNKSFIEPIMIDEDIKKMIKLICVIKSYNKL